MKQHETIEKTIGNTTFYIRPFPAMISIGVHSNLLVAIAPIVAPLASGNGNSITDMDVSAFISAISSLSGEKVEALLKMLLIKHDNVSVETNDGVKLLDIDIFNEIFCGEAQNAFILAWTVIRANFPSIFRKAGVLSGNPKFAEMMKILKNTDD